MQVGLTLSVVAVLLGTGRAVRRKRDLTLPGLLVGMMGVSLALMAADARMATFVFTAAVLNLFLAGMALIIVTRDATRRDAQVVGGLSMAIMPAHWIMSISSGAADWTIYAWSCNTVFVLQCLTSGGWFDGVGRSIVRLYSRLRPVPNLRDRGR